MKFLIADDHELFLKGLHMILEDSNPEADIITAKSYSDIFSIIEKNQDFDLILTDLAMPGAKWLDAIERIYQALPNTPIIILSAVFDKEIIQKTIEIGVSGYIPKTSSNSIIMGAIQLVLSGGVYIPPELLNNKVKGEFDLLKQIEPQTPENNEVSSNFGVLSPRQVEVLKLISQGKSNKQIAYELGLTEGTIKLHVTAILKELKVYNRTGAVIEASKLGIIDA